MDKVHQNRLFSYLGISLLFILGVFLRTRTSTITSDMRSFLIPWYDYIHSRGIFVALGNNFANYTPPYTYLLALTTLTASFLPKVTAIKLISILADFVNAFLVYKIVRVKYRAGLAPFWAAGVFLCLPTIFINSAIWGQADAVYSVFLLISLYSFLKGKPFWGMLAFSASLAFKLQAIFFAPFLLVMLLKKRVKLWHFLLAPAVYVLLCLPVVLLGRSWGDVLTIYLNQSETYRWLSGNAPTLYIFISNHYYQIGLGIGLAVAAIGTGTWIILTTLHRRPLAQERLALIALISVALLPFLLPKMHERYFYPADVFSLVAAFFFPKIWFMPLAYQIISGMSYTVYMWRMSVINVKVAALVNMVAVAALLWQQFRSGQPTPEGKPEVMDKINGPN